jgi:hypothetical protein
VLGGNGEAGGRSIESLRYREDGFTPEKQKVFLKVLRKTGCVADAARKAGVSTTTITRLRRLFADFDAACEAARRMAVPQLEEIAYRRATIGAPAKIIRNGALYEVRIKPSDSMLRLLLAGAAPEKYGRYAGRPGKAAAEKKRKVPEEIPIEQVRDEVLAQVANIRRHKIRREGYTSGPDGTLMPPGWRMVEEAELARLGWTPPPAPDAPEQDADDAWG